MKVFQKFSVITMWRVDYDIAPICNSIVLCHEIHGFPPLMALAQWLAYTENMPRILL